MKLKQIADVRTGIVVTRKKATDISKDNKKYKMINLKCINEKGFIDYSLAEPFETKERLLRDCLTKRGDIIIRLSVPYTAILVKNSNEEGFVIPSHFAIIRADEKKVVPEYLKWVLRSNRVQQQIRKNNSGSSGFGTISSGFFANLEIKLPPLERQQIIGKILMLAEREQELLYTLAEEKEKYNHALFEMTSNMED